MNMKIANRNMNMWICSRAGLSSKPVRVERMENPILDLIERRRVENLRLIQTKKTVKALERSTRSRRHHD